MSTGGPSAARYLVEWYRPATNAEALELSVERLMDCAASASAAGTPVHLLATVAVPVDEIVFAVFDSASEQTVSDVCRMAGCPAQRLTGAVDARFWPGT
ncbi:MAG: hypothetical protein QOD39_2766 [Mycobacterium sp.]|nr:hypothetical protein [Mycobacterium sp.]